LKEWGIMNSATHFSGTIENEQPALTGLWSPLRALFRRGRDVARDGASAAWPDELSAHYLRDVGLEHGGDTLSEPTVHALRVGPRAS
jgi:hypothetical protein